MFVGTCDRDTPATTVVRGKRSMNRLIRELSRTMCSHLKSLGEPIILSSLGPRIPQLSLPSLLRPSALLPFLDMVINIFMRRSVPHHRFGVSRPLSQMDNEEKRRRSMAGGSRGGYARLLEVVEEDQNAAEPLTTSRLEIDETAQRQQKMSRDTESTDLGCSKKTLQTRSDQIELFLRPVDRDGRGEISSSVGSSTAIFAHPHARIMH